MITMLPEAVEENDRPLITQLYLQYEKQLYLLAMDILGNHHDAQDCVQDTFASVARHIGRYRERAEESRIYLLRASCRNIAIDRYRKKARTPTASLTWEEEGSADWEMADPDEDVFADLVSRLTRETLIGLIRSLSPKYREVIILRYYENMTLGEIAEHLEIAPKTVYNRLHRAYELLREKGGKSLHELYYNDKEGR